MSITLERWAQLEEKIKENIKWAAYTKIIGFIHELYRSGTLSTIEYLNLHEETVLTLSGEKQ